MTPAFSWHCVSVCNCVKEKKNQSCKNVMNDTQAKMSLKILANYPKHKNEGMYRLIPLAVFRIEDKMPFYWMVFLYVLNPIGSHTFTIIFSVC
jgi:hypothetical protein